MKEPECICGMTPQRGSVVYECIHYSLRINMKLVFIYFHSELTHPSFRQTRQKLWQGIERHVYVDSNTKMISAIEERRSRHLMVSKPLSLFAAEAYSRHTTHTFGLAPFLDIGRIYLPVKADTTEPTSIEPHCKILQYEGFIEKYLFVP